MTVRSVVRKYSAAFLSKSDFLYALNDMRGLPFSLFLELKETNVYSVLFVFAPLHRIQIPFEWIFFKKHYTNGKCKQIKYSSKWFIMWKMKLISILLTNRYDMPMMSVSLLCTDCYFVNFCASCASMGLCVCCAAWTLNWLLFFVFRDAWSCLGF